VLKIDGLNAFPDNKLTIMSKDGAVVFEAKNYRNNIAAFDGHSNKGKLQKPGSYFYLLEYKAGAQVKRKTGYILLKY
ncbi:MAG: gliding motility-associated C-terminal domain-containing protein, partial [Mucilaginibacter sp.]